MSRDYSLVRPCPKCPFRTDVPAYLRPERVTEIAREVQGGANFYCHQTTVPDETDDTAMTTDEKSMVCAGSMILMEKAGAPNQMLRIAERIGMYDPTRLDMDAPVHGSWVEMQRHFEPEGEEGETCEIVNHGCLAPAGYAVGGSIVAGTDYVDEHCYLCGRAVCENCGDTTNYDGMDVFICADCIEEEEL